MMESINVFDDMIIVYIIELSMILREYLSDIFFEKAFTAADLPLHCAHTYKFIHHGADLFGCHLFVLTCRFGVTVMTFEIAALCDDMGHTDRNSAAYFYVSRKR